MRIWKRIFAFLLCFIVTFNVFVPKKSEAFVFASIPIAYKILLSGMSVLGTYVISDSLADGEITEGLYSLAINIWSKLSTATQEYLSELFENNTDSESVAISDTVMNEIIEASSETVQDLYIDSTQKLVNIPSNVDGASSIYLPYNIVNIEHSALTTYNITSDFYDTSSLKTPFVRYEVDSSGSDISSGFLYNIFDDTYKLTTTKSSTTPYYFNSLLDFNNNLLFQHKKGSTGYLKYFSIRYYGSTYRFGFSGDCNWATNSIDILPDIYGTNSPYYDFDTQYFESYFLFNTYSNVWGFITNVLNKSTNEIEFQYLRWGSSIDAFTERYIATPDVVTDVVSNDTIPVYTGDVTIPIASTLVEQLTTDVVGDSAGSVDTPDTPDTPEVPSTGTTEVGLLESILNAILGIPQTILEGIKAIFIPSQESIEAVFDMFHLKLPIIEETKDVVDETVDILTDENPEPPQIVVDFSGAESDINYGGKAVVLDFSWYEPYKETVDAVVIGFVYIVFFWRFFHRIPNILMGSDSLFDYISARSDEQNRVHDIGFGRRGTKK